METRLTPKDEIIRLLRGKGPLAAAEIASEMGTVVSAARQHLGMLRSSGLVVPEVMRQGVGRPSHRFHLTSLADDEFPKDYRELATALVSDLVKRRDTGAIESVFGSREKELVEFIRPKIEGLSFGAKLLRISELMSERGYMTDIKAVEGGYELAARNCPISAVTQHTHIPCHLELQLIENLLGVSVTRSELMAEGQSACVYRIPDHQTV